MTTESRSMGAFRRATAKRLREQPTGAEQLPWRQLRRFPIAGTHFRRQVPIGPYVADFACMAARLIIEVDGSQHERENIRDRDEKRTCWLEAEGYRVLRFWNNDITANMSGVLETIYVAIYGSSTAQPEPLKHQRHRRLRAMSADHPTPARFARRPSPFRGG